MSVYHGRKGVVYMSTTGSGTAGATVSLTEWSLSMATDTVETSAFGDPNKNYVQGLKDVSGTISGFWNDANEVLFAAADSADGVKLYLYPSSDATTRYFYGPAWVDVSVNTGVSAAVAVAVNFKANGAWGRKTA